MHTDVILAACCFCSFWCDKGLNMSLMLQRPVCCFLRGKKRRAVVTYPTQPTMSLKFPCPACVPSSCFPWKVALPRKMRGLTRTIIHPFIGVTPVLVSLVFPIPHLCIHWTSNLILCSSTTRDSMAWTQQRSSHFKTPHSGKQQAS